MHDDIPYLLLTPGPLTTSPGVRQTMLHDYCTWDADYKSIVHDIRTQLVNLATSEEGFTTVLMQGSGTFSVEAALGSLVPPDGKVLVLNNGAYGARIAQICQRLNIRFQELCLLETEAVKPEDVDNILWQHKDVTHVAVIHCETTTGLLNPVAEIGRVVARHQKYYMVDAMSSFGGIPMSMEEFHADCLISSSNKCIQGVPGFGYVIVKRDWLQQSEGWARSLSLDLYDQWKTMESQSGKWRYTSPTHVVRAFAQALQELHEEGGVSVRHERYRSNQRCLAEGMTAIGFRRLLAPEVQSPIITSFYYPDDPNFTFEAFYQALKKRGFVIYPGKISQTATFRIGNIGHVFLDDIKRLLVCVEEALKELGMNPARE